MEAACDKQSQDNGTMQEASGTWVEESCSLPDIRDCNPSGGNPPYAGDGVDMTFAAICLQSG